MSSLWNCEQWKGNSVTYCPIPKLQGQGDSSQWPGMSRCCPLSSLPQLATPIQSGACLDASFP